MDVSTEEISLVELKRPGFFSKGHIAINLTSHNSFKLLLLESPEDYGKECFDAAKELFQKHLKQALRSA